MRDHARVQSLSPVVDGIYLLFSVAITKPHRNRRQQNRAIKILKLARLFALP